MRDQKQRAREPLELAEGRVRREIEAGLRVPAPGRADPVADIEELIPRYAAPNRRAEARAAGSVARVEHAFEASRRRYGYRRVRASVASGADGLEPMAVSEREVRRAMREGAMRPVRTRRRARWTSYRGEPDERPANLPLRGDGSHDFSAGEPDRLVVTDVTEFAVAGGAKVYLSPVIDCFDGMPVSWSVSRRPDSALVDSSLLAYAARLPEGHPPVTAHSDGGATYRSRSWKGICERSGIVRSMSRRGRCPDNARMEGFFGALKEALQREGLVADLARGVRRRARCVHGVVPGREAQAVRGGRRGVRYDRRAAGALGHAA